MKAFQNKHQRMHIRMIPSPFSRPGPVRGGRVPSQAGVLPHDGGSRRPQVHQHADPGERHQEVGERAGLVVDTEALGKF